LLRAFPAGSVVAATGVEIDPAFASAARQLWSAHGLRVIESDFTRIPPPDPNERYNLVIANPPYVRHHHLSRDDKARLRAAVGKVLGHEPNGLAGLYCYFMALADAWMAEDALGVWLVPSEFMSVNYGHAIRQYLARQVCLLRIHRFDAETSQFDDALVSSAVVAFRKSPPPPNHSARLTWGGSLLAPDLEDAVPVSTLAHTPKWTRYPNMRRGHGDVDGVAGSLPTLSSLLVVKRGIATGANGFFILPRSRAKTIGIAEDFLRPVLPSPRRLAEAVIRADPLGYPLLPNPLVLIDTALPEEEIRARCPPLWRYLKEGEAQGITSKYLLRNREPWYRQERREPAPYLCTYMGRGPSGRTPFRFIRNYSDAIATNVYLLLYPVGALRAAIDTDPAKADQFYRLLCSIGADELKGEGRMYGGGLHKLEPKELGRVSAGWLVEELGLCVRPPAQQHALDL